MTSVYPSILSCDFGKLLEEVQAVEAAGADGIHVDVMDGVFVPNLTIGPPVVRALKGKTKLPLDCHLMVVDPDPLVGAFASAGANSLTVHLEACRHLQRTLQNIKSHGMKAGVSINPGTPFEGLEWVLDDVDLILSMTVNPGFGGQKLIPAALEKTKALISWLGTKTAKKIPVQVDGGIDPSTAASARAIGVDILVAGSAVFHSKNYAAAIQAIRGTAA